MARKLNGIALTEKGALKNAVRQGATEYVAKKISTLDCVESVENKPNKFVVEFEDTQGNVFYSEISITTSLKHPNDKAEKKSSHRKTEPETISWE